MEQRYKDLLGKKGIYTVTGFTGVITAVTVQNSVARPEQVLVLLETNDSTGRPVEWTVDYTKLEIVEGE